MIQPCLWVDECFEEICNPLYFLSFWPKTQHSRNKDCVLCTRPGGLLFRGLSGLIWRNFSFCFFFPLCKYFHFSSALKRECVKKGGNYSKSIAIVCSLYIFFFLPSRRNWGAKSAKLWFICQISNICLETRRENLLLQPYRCLRARFTMCSPAYVGYNVLWSVILYVLRLVWWVRKMMTGNQAG